MQRSRLCVFVCVLMDDRGEDGGRETSNSSFIKWKLEWTHRHETRHLKTHQWPPSATVWLLSSSWNRWTRLEVPLKSSLHPPALPSYWANSIKTLWTFHLESQIVTLLPHWSNSSRRQWLQTVEIFATSCNWAVSCWVSIIFFCVCVINIGTTIANCHSALQGAHQKERRSSRPWKYCENWNPARFHHTKQSWADVSAAYLAPSHLSELTIPITQGPITSQNSTFYRPIWSISKTESCKNWKNNPKMFNWS